jgi:hypothetical protein
MVCYSGILSRSVATTGSFNNEAFEVDPALIGSGPTSVSSPIFPFGVHAISASGLFGFSLTQTTPHLFVTAAVTKVIMKGTFSGGKQ